MQLTIDNSFQTSASIDKVWEFLNDPNKVVTCVPGAKITEEIDEDNFKGTIIIKVGPITTEYNGDATIEVRDKANYKLKLTGKGVATRGMGNASMVMNATLKTLKDGGTQVVISVNTTITGRIAQLGSRMIKAVSDKMFNEFVSNFEQKLQSDDNLTDSDNKKEPTEVKPISALSLISAVTPLWVKIIVPLVIIAIIYIILSFAGIVSPLI